MTSGLKSVGTLAAIIGLMAGVSAVSAHHSGTMFDPARTETITGTITGTIKKLRWVNPHVSLLVFGTTKEGEEQSEWLLDQPQRARSSGMDADQLQGRRPGGSQYASAARRRGARRLAAEHQVAGNRQDLYDQSSRAGEFEFGLSDFPSPLSKGLGRAGILRDLAYGRF